MPDRIVAPAQTKLPQARITPPAGLCRQIFPGVVDALLSTRLSLAAHRVSEVMRVSLVVCIALAWPAVGRAACDGKSSAQIAQILARETDLNDRFKRSVKSADEAAYRSLQQQHEQYSEDVAMPCLRKASQLLAREVDEPLLEKSVAFSISHESSADETVSQAMASVFAHQPAAIATSLSKLSPSRARAWGVSPKLRSGLACSAKGPGSIRAARERFSVEGSAGCAGEERSSEVVRPGAGVRSCLLPRSDRRPHAR